MRPAVNIDRQIKRLVLARPQRAIIRFPHGLGPVCRDEVENALASPLFPAARAPRITLSDAAVEVQDLSYRELLALTLRLKTAREIFWVIAEGQTDTAPVLKKRISAVPWDVYLPVGASVGLRVVSTGSRLYHEGRLKETVGHLLETQRRSVQPFSEAPHQLDIRLVNDRLQLALGLAGRPLYQRRYKTVWKGLAPLKEDLAAGAVRLALGQALAGRPVKVWVPFAGSGTLGFEAALALAGIPHWIFFGALAAEDFPCTPASSMRFARQKLLDQWLSSPSTPAPAITFVERDPEQARALSQNCAAFNRRLRECQGGEVPFVVREGDAFAEAPTAREDEQVLVLLNPPYGDRLDADGGASQLYARLGRQLSGLETARVFGAAFVPDPRTLESLVRAMPDFTVKSWPIRHGGRPVVLATFQRP